MLPPDPYYKNQNKLIHDQFIYSDGHEMSAFGNSSVHHRCHKRPQINHDRMQSTSHYLNLFVSNYSTLPSYVSLVCLHLYMRDVFPTHLYIGCSKIYIHNLKNRSLRSSSQMRYSHSYFRCSRDRRNGRNS